VRRDAAAVLWLEQIKLVFAQGVRVWAIKPVQRAPELNLYVGITAELRGAG
jgi:hypothetical protein